jgi:hypothetical protein
MNRDLLCIAAGAFVVCGFLRATAYSQELDTEHVRTSAAVELRSGGVLEESFVYHRQPVQAGNTMSGAIAPAGDWYGYGFPVKTFRWGWFGAGRYPHGGWYHGYYGDCCHRSYRRGY